MDGRYVSAQRSQQQDPMTLNGGSILAMAGKDCVAIAVDKRFGSGSTLISLSSRRIMTLDKDNVMVAFCGLDGDIHSLQRDISQQLDIRYHRHQRHDQRHKRSRRRYRSNSNRKISNRSVVFEAESEQTKEEEEEEAEGVLFNEEQQTGEDAVRDEEDDDEDEEEEDKPCMSPRSMASLISHILYERKRSPYYVEPLVVGLEDVPSSSSTSRQKKKRPYLCSMDIIGAKSISSSSSYICSGAAQTSLYGTAEAMYKPNMESKELLYVICTAFLSALERDSLSGYGAFVYLLMNDGSIIQYDIQSRDD